MQRDPLLLVRSFDRVGQTGELRLQRVAGREQPAPILVEARVLGVVERPELVAVAVVGEHGEPGLRGSERKLLAPPFDSRREDRVLELVLSARELGRDDSRLAGLAQPVEQLAPARVLSGFRFAESLQLSRREEVAVALDDRSLLGGLLLPHPDRPRLLGTLEEVAREALLEVGRRPNDCGYRTASSETAAVSSSRAKGLPRTPGNPSPDGRRDLARPGEHHDAQRQIEPFDVVQELEPVVRADVDVEQNDVDRLGRQQLPRGRERSRLDHPVPLELEVDPAEKPEGRLVVDDENRGARAIHRAESRRSVGAIARSNPACNEGVDSRS